MDPRHIIPLAPQSPWSAWERPDIHHCEANLAGWIAAPADTWSNLAYVLAAAWLWRRREEPRARALAAIVLSIGVTSFLFHASYTFFFQVFDYAGMFLYTGWIIGLGLRRAGWLEEKAATILYAALCLASTLLVVFFHYRGWPVQRVFGAHVVAATALEGWLCSSRERSHEIKPLALSLALFAAAFLLWNLDHKDWFCRPDDHWLQGHALWHLLTAASFVPAFRYFRQF